MPEALGFVVSDLYPYTYDMRADRVYAVVELDDEDDEKPHTALVLKKGIRKGDRVKVSYEAIVPFGGRNYMVDEKI